MGEFFGVVNDIQIQGPRRICGPDLIQREYGRLSGEDASDKMDGKLRDRVAKNPCGEIMFQEDCTCEGYNRRRREFIVFQDVIMRDPACFQLPQTLGRTDLRSGDPQSRRRRLKSIRRNRFERRSGRTEPWE